MSLKVLGSPLSPFVRKVVITLRQKGVDFDLDHSISPFSLPDGFAELNPLKRIPVLLHNEFPIADSAIICRYLDDLYPHESLYPTGAAELARVSWFEKFADYELGEQLTLQAFRLLLLFPLMGKSIDAQAIRAELDEKLPPLLNYLNEQIGDRDYLVGEQFTIADLATVVQFMNYRYSGETLEEERWPNIARYLELHLNSERFAAILEKEMGLASKMRTKAGLDN